MRVCLFLLYFKILIEGRKVIKTYYNLRRKLLLIIIILAAFYEPVTAGGNPELMLTTSINSPLTDEVWDTKKDENVNWYQMFTQVPSDYYLFLKDSFSKEEIPTFVNLAIVTGSLMSIDQTGWKFQNSLFTRSGFVRKYSDLAIDMGNSKYQLGLAALFALQGTVFGDAKSFKTASNIVESVLSTGLFVQVLKRITGRESPVASTQPGGDWELFPSPKQYQKNQPRYYSFPSGHLSTATAIITVIENNYPDATWLKPVGYSLLGVLGISLVNEGMHWYSDLPLAYFIGYTFGNIVAPNNQNDESLLSKHFLFTPSFNTIKGVELNATYSF